MLCGVALGYFLSHLQMMRHMEGMQKRGPKMFVPGILRSLEYGLDLRRDQSKKIEKVLKETAQEVQDFHQQTVHPKIVEIFEAGMEKIEKELTAKQKEEFQEMGNPFHPRKPNQSFDREGHYPPPPPHHLHGAHPPPPHHLHGAHHRAPHPPHGSTAPGPHHRPPRMQGDQRPFGFHKGPPPPHHFPGSSQRGDDHLEPDREGGSEEAKD